VSFIDGATSNTPNLVTWNGELAPSRGHAILHTLRILEEKERTIPVIVRYEDEAGGKREASTTIIVGAQVPVTQTPVTTRAPESTVREVTYKVPGFTGLLVLIGLAAGIVLVKKR
jgi:hypothetical protein